jgi:hypothetical protein
MGGVLGALIEATPTLGARAEVYQNPIYRAVLRNADRRLILCKRSLSLYELILQLPLIAASGLVTI